MYNRAEKSFRTFIVEHGPGGIGNMKVTARSSLEAGVIFMEVKPLEVMTSIKDTRP